jgi:hypothetical protein
MLKKIILVAMMAWVITTIDCSGMVGCIDCSSTTICTNCNATLNRELMYL